MKVAVLGAAGGIGRRLLLLKPNCPSGSELSLYDIAPVTPGVAVDLSHIPTAVKIKGFSGEDATPALEGADVVLISAGVARKPGMDRSDLFNVNAGIVKKPQYSKLRKPARKRALVLSLTRLTPQLQLLLKC